MPLSPGNRLGAYEIVSTLGQGGMGVVYRARHTILNREVAIKALPDRLAEDPQALARFEREAQATAALSHPNILAIHDFGSDGSVRFAVTELLEGETLRQQLSRYALAWRRAVELAVEIAEGLAAAHAKGVVHRDLKPENIFITTQGRAKILDFGLARVKPALVSRHSSAPTAMLETQPGMVMGTIGYMSPEQVKGAVADAPSDIFSLGCVLHEMLGGRQPFSRGSPAETMAAILYESVPELADPTLPAGLRRVLAQCLEKRAEARFQSARDLAFQLREILSGSQMKPAAEVPEPVSSIAVLPLTNPGGDPDLDYLCEGITESLINHLSQMANVRVSPRSSVFRYRERDVDPQAIAGELKVQTLLTGRLTRRADTLRVQTELVDVRRGAQLWGQRLQKKFADLFEIEEEIAAEISRVLKLRLLNAQSSLPSRRHTVSSEAYESYLKGRYHWNKRNAEGLRKAIEYFESAVAQDPAYALPYTGLADCYVVLAWYRYAPPRALLPKAKALAEQALEMEGRLAEAHTSLALAKALMDWDWQASLAHFQQALALNPHYITAHLWQGLVLAALGRAQDAIASLKRALELDALAVIPMVTLGWIYHFARDYDLALEQYRRTLEISPDLKQSHWLKGLAYEQLGRMDKAIASLARARSVPGEVSASAMAHTYACSGRQDEARCILAELHAEAQRTYISAYDFALVHMGLGEEEQTLDWLERAAEERASWLIFAKVEPRFDQLRAHPRFQNLLGAMGLG